MLSLPELERAARILDATVSGHRLQAVVQPDATSVALELYGRAEGDERGARRRLLLCCRGDTSRVSWLDAMPKAPERPLAFAQYLRAHALGARCGGVRILERDRQLCLRLRANEGDLELMLSIFGRRSNVVLLDAAGCVVQTLRPLSETRPELAAGQPWRTPASRAPIRGDDRFGDVADEELLVEIERRYSEREREGERDSLRGRVERALRREATRILRKLEKLERELDAAKEATGLERQGQLLKSVLGQVKRGDTRAVARDFESGDAVVIPLDPMKTPADNLAALFKRYRKALRVLTRGGAQQEAVLADRDSVRDLVGVFESIAADDDAALDELAARPAVASLLAKSAPKAQPGKTRPGAPREMKVGGKVVPPKLVPRRYRTAGDLEIWVGRSDAGNDYLSTRLARGKDLFFHLDGAPGSHVILRTEGRSDPPSEAILDACELAVHNSKARKATRADVHVVPIKNVRKPKGAKPGLVTVHGGKTVHLRRSEARLERILAARAEDDARGPTPSRSAP